MRKISNVVALVILFSSSSWAFKNSPQATDSSGKRKLMTNAALISNAPHWLGSYQVNKVVSRVERKLEWSTRRVNVEWYKTQADFDKAFGRDAQHILAFARRQDHSIHMGPKVSKQNFEMVFAHELAHVIMFQKYKKAIPHWLEEGMANFVAENTTVDFKQLAQKPKLNVFSLAHPLNAASKAEVDFKYMASLAFIMMLQERCPNFRELLNLSLRENIEAALPTYCKITDPNQTFWAWVEEKNSGASTDRSPSWKQRRRYF